MSTYISTVFTDKNESDNKNETEVKEYAYRWIENDDRFDCVVAISIDKKPVGIGIFINNHTVITSANSIFHVRNEYSRIKIHTIDGHFNRSKTYGVKCVLSAFRDDDRSIWVRQGFDRKNSPLNDVFTLSVTAEDENIPTAPKVAYVQSRKPFHTHWGWRSRTYRDTCYAGFGYIDQDHVRDSYQLEIECNAKPIVVDCDEWVPRTWGRFVCMSNVDNYVGLQSGAPLFVRGGLHAIGSFALQKGNESILVFTKMSLYYDFVACE